MERNPKPTLRAQSDSGQLAKPVVHFRENRFGMPARPQEDHSESGIRIRGLKSVFQISNSSNFPS